MRYPIIRTAGYDGLLVTFGNQLSESANRAALAFQQAVEVAAPESVTETSTSLVSVYLKFDPQQVSHDKMIASVDAVLSDGAWFDAPLPAGRSLWRIPAVFGGSHGPQLAKAAHLAGMSETDAIADITTRPVRVQTIGFAPGMPYLGQLSQPWDIPRQTTLTGEVPAGGLCVAIRQLVLFPNATPTGWRHIAQSAVRLFQPESDKPFMLRPGDEVLFEPVTAEALANLADDPSGGARREDLQ